MNFPFFNQDEIRKEFNAVCEKIERENKELADQIHAIDGRRKKLSRELEPLQSEEKQTGDELERLILLERRPWAILADKPCIHDTTGSDPEFDYAGFNEKAALAFLKQSREKELLLKAKLLALRCKAEPIQRELTQLNREYFSLDKWLHANRKPDWTMFELQKQRQALLPATVR